MLSLRAERRERTERKIASFSLLSKVPATPILQNPTTQIQNPTTQTLLLRLFLLRRELGNVNEFSVSWTVFSIIFSLLNLQTQDIFIVSFIAI